jgi:hypothetical protein
MLHLDSGANTSSERRPEPERTSRAPRHDATTDDQTDRADPLPSRQTREDVPRPHPLRPRAHSRRHRGRLCCAADTGPAASGLRPAASSSHSSACERAIRAASRARRAARRSCAASSVRFACSCLSACASASAALCSSVTAVRRSIDASCAARTRVSPTTRSAAALGGSTASESIAPTIMAP